ncbi:MAG: M56 family metallopeptidase [Lachnospiraceae bacterium]|nr:M56 family metallopeptidase [Lachnospiraceae bacterium]
MVNWISSSSILILAIILLRHIFKGKISLRLQYGLWLLVVVRLLVPFNFGASDLSVQNLTEKVSTQPQIQNAIEFSEQMIPITSYESAYEEVIERYEEEGRFVEGIGAEELESMEYEAYSLMEEISIGALAQRIASAIWIIGMVIVGTVFFVSNIVFGRKVKNNRSLLQQTDTKLPVYVSETVETPCLFGIFKPAIYVTKTVAENGTLLRHSVLHELTHYAHGDLLWSAVRCVCLVLHWYNPLVWKAAILSKQDAELACDEATLRKLGDDERIEYGETLIQLTCEKRQDLFVAATTMSAGKRSIKERIILIARKPKVRMYALVIVAVAALFAVGCTFTNGKEETDENSEKDNAIAETKEEVVIYEGMYSILVEVADGRILTVALDMELLHDEYYEVNQILVYDGDELIQTISCKDLAMPMEYAWDGLFVNKGYEVGEPDVRDVNFDGAKDFGLLAVSTYPKNVPYYYFVWNEEHNEFFYGFTLFGASALEVDVENRRLIEYSHDSMGQYARPYTYDSREGLIPLEPGVLLPKEMEKDKVCLAITIDGISKSGGDYRYIIPENQTEWMDAYKEMKSHAVSIKKPVSNVCSQGIWIRYNDEWTEITEDGFIIAFDHSVGKSEAERFWNLCVEEAIKYGSGTPLRPEEMSGIVSATLIYDGTYTVTNEKTLSRLEKALVVSKELRGGAACPFTATLVLELERGDTQIISLATDSCNVWLSDGVFYQYSDFEDVEEIKEIMQKAAYVEEREKIAPSQYLSEIDWRSMKGRFSEEEMEAIHRNLPALEGGEVTWIYRSADGEEPDTYLHDTMQTTLQGIVNQWYEENEREPQQTIVNSFLFADVFRSGKKDICLLVEHWGWYWIILHEEDGVIYAIDMPVRWFCGVQSDGLYYGSGGAEIAHYKRMTFSDGDYTEERVADVLYGVLYMDDVEQSDKTYQEWQKKYIKESAEWHTPIE